MFVLAGYQWSSGNVERAAILESSAGNMAQVCSLHFSFRTVVVMDYADCIRSGGTDYSSATSEKGNLSIGSTNP
uniref:Secreted protein n=1 Tax=Angiostrongylus cantonensis TaxID=6313 RepID=A0A0K0DDF4_ANGCA